ncbi:lipopolysaccharide biosynthesis protein [Ligilactobacillus salivarius]|uniref:lipopolysaccharide biosynthesis protein n=1 Tax=Ligilactobacillus salivarius TaxID=1624 RepID=UPI0009D9F365|nr:lipopolysaccharide biosynthesis protein [Ligilactobacillus salivarius]ATP35552.1 lipopolysaccharide biosynthesis protein [Ligilactobacillus salivarius]OQR01397.1 lipopolysaccharide biosynthesis protein [Ligilactobacillus salivarius]OQR03669.1 lipopolysaccharide biosynthesis protein [Ligilactobacillus salivarius]
MKNKVFTGFFWKFNEQISSQLVTFIISIILARLLTPKDYGIVALINVFISIADVFVTSGFGAALIQKKDADDTDFSTIFIISELFSIVVYIVIYLMAPSIANFYNNNDLTLIVRVFALKLPLSAFNAIQQAYVSKKMLFKKIFISTTASAIISGCIGIVLAYMGFGIWALIMQYILNTVIVSIALFVQLDWRPEWKFSWSSGKPLLNYGWKVLMTSILGAFFNQLRTLLLGKAYTPAELAYYNRGQKFPELLSQNIDGTISTVLFPAMSAYNDDLEKIKLLVRKSIKVSTFIIMPLMFGMAATAKPIILILLTDKWIESVPYMQYLCIAGAFGTISNTNMQAISAIGRSDILLNLELIKKPIYLLLLVVGLKISVLAVAYTMTIYSVCSALLNMSPNRKLLSYKFKEQVEDILPALILSITMFVIVELITLIKLPIFVMFIVQIFVGVVVYTLLALIFKLEACMYILEIIKSSKKKYRKYE